jgi:hypothetical protein
LSGCIARRSNATDSRGSRAKFSARRRNHLKGQGSNGAWAWRVWKLSPPAGSSGGHHGVPVSAPFESALVSARSLRGAVLDCRARGGV